VLPQRMRDIRYYVASDGQQPVAAWFADLEAVARAKVTRAIVRLEQGNLSKRHRCSAYLLAGLQAKQPRAALNGGRDGWNKELQGPG
jgi:hypothetical protein